MYEDRLVCHSLLPSRFESLNADKLTAMCIKCVSYKYGRQTKKSGYIICCLKIMYYLTVHIVEYKTNISEIKESKDHCCDTRPMILK